MSATDAVSALLATLLVAYAPGAIAFRLPFGLQDRRGRLPASERVFWAVLLSVVWSTTLVVILALAGAYRFERLLAINAVCSSIALAAFRGRLKYRARAAGPAWIDAAPTVLVIFGLWSYFPPSELVTGGIDAGTYLNEGIRIAQTERLIITDATVGSVPEPFRDLFFPSYQVPWYYSLRFMGFFILSPDAGTVLGQLPHFFPGSIALGYGLNGLSGARQAIGVWAILGLVAVCLVGSRVAGPIAGAVAALLLSTNVLEVWFARYPNTELPSQAMLFGALLAFSRTVNTGRVFFGAICGALLGLQLLLRFDAVLAIAAFATAAALWAFVDRRTGWSFGIVLTAVTGVSLLYLAAVMEPYSVGLFGYSRDRGGWLLVGLVLAALWGVRASARWPAWAAVVRRTAPPALAVGVICLAAYAYFFRQPTGRLAPADAMALRTFAWYMTPWGLAAALAGFAVLARRVFWREPAFFLLLTTYAVFFFYKTRIVPEHFWMGRRFMSVILPGAMLCFAGLVPAVLDVIRPKIAGGHKSGSTGGPTGYLVATAVTVAAAAPLAFAFWTASAPVRHHVEFAGVIPRLEVLARQVGDGDLLIVESRSSSDTHVLALPLAYIYARNVLVFANPTPDKELLAGFLQWASGVYSRVLFLGAGGTDLVMREIAATAVFSDRFEIPEYDSPLNQYPSGVRSKKFSLNLYALEPRDGELEAASEIRIGGQDDVQVLRFHAKELDAETGTPFRWTTDVSYVVVPWRTKKASRVTIWMGTGGRPPQAPQPTVEVSLGEHHLGTAAPVDDIRPYTFDVSSEVSAALAAEDDVRLRLRVPTWRPGEALGTADDRELGVIVTRVEVR
jgi:hypothetical protein